MNHMGMYTHTHSTSYMVWNDTRQRMHRITWEYSESCVRKSGWQARVT